MKYTNVIGLTIIIIGFVSFVQGINYHIGSLNMMGPGWWPTILSLLLMIGGTLIFFRNRSESESINFPIIPILKISLWLSSSIMILKVLL
jgi:hypothetical protein